MADTTTDEAEVFRPQALGRLQTADDLDAYIQVTSPSGWIVLVASIVFLVSIIIWSNTALVPTTRTFSGLQNGEYINAWVDEATFHNIKEGQTTAKVAGVKARLIDIDDTPMSRSEILTYLQYDYLTSSAITYDWNYLIVLKLEDELKVNQRSEAQKRANDEVADNDSLDEAVDTEKAGDADETGDAEKAGDTDEAGDAEKAGDADEVGEAVDADEAVAAVEDFIYYDERLVPVDVTTAETHPIRLVFQGE